MKQITGEEFVGLIEKDPSWCKNLKKEVEITTFVNLAYSNITHLSPLITFSGKNKNGWVVDFGNCEQLKVATGTYKGFANFSYSEIEKIENLNVTGVDTVIDSAYFLGCKNLKVATGTYKGFVNFSESGIETIKDLNIENTNINGEKTRFEACPIKYVPKEYRGKGYLYEDKIIENSIKKDKIVKETINKIKSEANNIEI